MRKSRDIWKVKREGKQIGSWYYTLPGGKRVNTHTSDANRALRMRAAALAKLKKTAVEGAADAPLAALDEPDAGITSAAPLADPTAPASSPVQSGGSPADVRALPPIEPDGYAPPPEPADAGDWTADAARAAAGAGPPPPQMPEITPEFVDAILKGAADRMIAIQVWGQSIALKYVGGLAAGEVTIDEQTRGPIRDAWLETFKSLLPDDLKALPPWVFALGATAFATLPTQLFTATKIPKKGEKPAAPGDAPPTVDDGVQVAA